MFIFGLFCGIVGTLAFYPERRNARQARDEWE